VQAAAVQVRGWDYPHVDHENRAQGSDSISSWIEWGEHLEYWQLFQSGQFLHLLGFWEDRNESADWATERARHGRSSLVTGANDFMGILLTLTEIYDFAAGLALERVFGESCEVRIGLVDIQGRTLTSFDSRRHWTKAYQASAPTLQRPPQVEDTARLVSGCRELALDAAIWFYERFGWLDAPRELLEREQQSLFGAAPRHYP
jgi:hypothetical protein